MAYNIKNKRLVLTILIGVLTTLIFISGVSGSLTTPDLLNRHDWDWDYWSNSPDMYAFPDGNVGIGGVPPSNAKLYVKSEFLDWKYGLYTESDKGIKSVSTALEGTGITGEGGHAGVSGNGFIGILGTGYYGGWFEGQGVFTGDVGIGTTEPEARLDVQGGDLKVDGFNVIVAIGSAKQSQDITAGGTWTDIPGVIFNFTLPREKTVNLRAHGAALITSGYAGFRFVIDSIPYGSADYGDLIVGGSSYNSWYIERQEIISEGPHSVKIQLRCQSGNVQIVCEDCLAAKLFVESW